MKVCQPPTPHNFKYPQHQILYPPLRRKMTQFIIGLIVATNAALTILRFHADSVIGNLILNDHKRAFINQL
jgi:hypothetical protein